MLKVYRNFSPIVSIITATYNRANLLGRSIESVIRQTFKEWELIIVDDGSTDNTFNIINQYINDYPIRYIKQSNKKPPVSKNAGIQMSNGSFITFLDSDDEYKNNHLELRVEYMNANPKTDLIYGGVEIIGNPYVKDKNNLKKLIHLSKCVIGGTFFGKRGVFVKLSGFKDLNYSEDNDLIERAKKLFKVKKVDFKTYIYNRKTKDSICNTI